MLLLLLQVLLLLLVTTAGWRARLLIVVAGGLLPVGYQIFRMGYYALLVPGTAVAKEASGSRWEQGFLYLANFNNPYLLWIPAVLLIALGLLLVATRTRPWWVHHEVAGGHSRLVRTLQSPPTVVTFITLSGLIQAIYWIRQGGDFMHGRVLLTQPRPSSFPCVRRPRRREVRALGRVAQRPSSRCSRRR